MLSAEPILDIVRGLSAVSVKPLSSAVSRTATTLAVHISGDTLHLHTPVAPPAFGYADRVRNHLGWTS